MGNIPPSSSLRTASHRTLFCRRSYKDCIASVLMQRPPFPEVRRLASKLLPSNTRSLLLLSVALPMLLSFGSTSISINRNPSRLPIPYAVVQIDHKNCCILITSKLEFFKLRKYTYLRKDKDIGSGKLSGSCHMEFPASIILL